MKHHTTMKSDFKAFCKSPWGMALVASIAPQIAKVRAWGIDPDGFNLANGAKGFMYLQWTDENGQTQTLGLVKRLAANDDCMRSSA